jgi:hypothetical protein
MLNGYLDRTFVSGLTYSFEGRPRTAVFPHGLMRDKEAHFFYTLDSPWLVALLDPGWFSNLLTVFWYCGFRRVRRYYLARLKLRTDEQRARWLVTVREHAGRIAERLPAGRVLAGCLNNNAHQGRDLGDKVEIVSGLNPTESLVANPTDALRDGSEVKVQAQPSKGSDQQVNAKPTEKKS